LFVEIVLQEDICQVERFFFLLSRQLNNHTYYYGE
jgi:hypothetical protein